jgi:hypothetical protein
MEDFEADLGALLDDFGKAAVECWVVHLDSQIHVP